MKVGRIGICVATATIVVGLSLGLSSCGGGGTSNTQAGPAKSKVSATSTTTTLTPRESAVLTAYRASWVAFEQALGTANAYDSALPATMVDPQLQHVQAALLGDQNAGVIGKGSFNLHPKIISLTSTSASVVDCAFSTSKLIYAKTGKAVPPATSSEHDGVSTTLVLSGATWKVSQQEVKDGSCASGS
jgi:hypothetical protein